MAMKKPMAPMPMAVEPDADDASPMDAKGSAQMPMKAKPGPKKAITSVDDLKKIYKKKFGK